MTHWSVSGQFAVRTRARADEAWWRWDQALSHRRLVVLGPLGRVILTMTADPGRVRVESGNGQRYTGSRAQPLVQRLTGWRLPTADLSYWLRGLARPGHPARMSSIATHPILEQDGWQVQFQRYTQVRGLRLPQLLVLTYPDRVDPKVRLRLLIQRWRIGS